MSKAEELFENIYEKGRLSLKEERNVIIPYELPFEYMPIVLAAMKEIASDAFDAGYKRGCETEDIEEAYIADRKEEDFIFPNKSYYLAKLFNNE